MGAKATCHAQSAEFGGEVSPPAVPVSTPPSIDNAYEIQEILGTGTSGFVRRAKCKASGATVAVKTLEYRACRAADLRTGLRREIEMMLALDHPNILKLHETYEDAESIHLVMELCTGGDLMDRIEQCSHLSEEAAAVVLRQVCNALFYMHSHKICHRDLKPENLMLANPGAVSVAPVKVIDFGLATRFDGKVLRTWACTPYYVAPEVLSRAYSEACDLWSLGVIAYVALSGNVPFAGDTPAETLEKVKSGRYDYADRVWTGISAEAKALIDQLLVLDPKRRLTAEQAVQHPWLAGATAAPAAVAGQALAPGCRVLVDRNKGGVVAAGPDKEGDYKVEYDTGMVDLWVQARRMEVVPVFAFPNDDCFRDCRAVNTGARADPPRDEEAHTAVASPKASKTSSTTRSPGTSAAGSDPGSWCSEVADPLMDADQGAGPSDLLCV